MCILPVCQKYMKKKGMLLDILANKYYDDSMYDTVIFRYIFYLLTVMKHSIGSYFLKSGADDKTILF